MIVRRRHTTVLAIALGVYGLWRDSTTALVAGLLILLWANWRAPKEGIAVIGEASTEGAQYNPVGSFRTDTVGTAPIAVVSWPGGFKCC
jgi:hypothetical protein